MSIYNVNGSVPYGGTAFQEISIGKINRKRIDICGQFTQKHRARLKISKDMGHGTCVPIRDDIKNPTAEDLKNDKTAKKGKDIDILAKFASENYEKLLELTHEIDAGNTKRINELVDELSELWDNFYI